MSLGRRQKYSKKEETKMTNKNFYFLLSVVSMAVSAPIFAASGQVIV